MKSSEKVVNSSEKRQGDMLAVLEAMREMEKHGQRRNHEYQECMAKIIEDIAKSAVVEPVSPTASMRAAVEVSPSKNSTVAAAGSRIKAIPTRVVLSPPKTMRNIAEKEDRPILRETAKPENKLRQQRSCTAAKLYSSEVVQQ